MPACGRAVAFVGPARTPARRGAPLLTRVPAHGAAVSAASSGKKPPAPTDQGPLFVRQGGGLAPVVQRQWRGRIVDGHQVRSAAS
jgi:hypothetical protein